MIDLANFLCAFKNKTKAYKSLLCITSKLGLLENFINSAKEIKESLNACANPDQAFDYFERFLENTTAKSTLFEILKASKFYRDLLFNIFSQSNTLSLLLINHNEYFYLLIEDINSSKTKTDFYEEIKSHIKSKKTIDEKKYLLREYRKKEYLRIASKEISRIFKPHTIYAELSELADACLEIALDIACEKENFKEKNLCIVSMGKLGAKELNFSSDIDIMFIHDNSTSLNKACKIAQDVVSIISDLQFGNFVFRVDTRLRPFGNNSSLSLSLDEYENYYFSFGQIWEKFALTRARFSAGSFYVAQKFFSIIHPFVYTKNIDIKYVEDIRSIRYKIKSTKLTNNKESIINPLKLDVKLGIGGIREAEFITQYFQLLYGGKDPDLQINSTVEILNILRNKHYLKQAHILKACYLFLRLVEHKLQLKDEKQITHLPSNQEELEIFSKIFNFELKQFVKIYNKITDTIHGIYKSIFYAPFVPIFSPTETLEEFFEENFKDYKQIAFIISDIARKSKFVNLNPQVLSSAIESIYDAFKSLPQSINDKLFVNSISGFNSILPSYFDVFFGNKNIFDIATKIFSIGFGNKIIQYPFLIDEFFSIEQPLKIIDLTKEEKERLEFNIALKFLSSKLDKSNKKILSDFAVAYLKNLIKTLSIKDIVVLGYGKLGMHELFLNSDLDLVFLAKKTDEKKISEISNLVKELNKLYAVDLRLRPYGDKGLLVCDIEYFKNYLEKYAKDWEKLAIQKARIVYSDVEHNLNERIDKFVYSLNQNTIKEMKNLIEIHKGFDIKSAKGGIVDIEFILQYLCIKEGCFRFGKSVEEMTDEIPVKEAKFLKGAYVFFTNILNLTRLIPNDIKDKFIVMEFLLGTNNLENKIKKLQNKVSMIFNTYFP